MLFINIFFIITIVIQTQANILIDFGSDKTSIAKYSLRPNEFNLIESKLGKKSIPSIVAINSEGAIYVGESAEREMTHHGNVYYNSLVFANGMTTQLNEINREKRKNIIQRENDDISVLKSYPLTLQFEKRNISYPFLLSSFISEIISLVDNEDNSREENTFNVISIPSFYTPKQIDLINQTLKYNKEIKNVFLPHHLLHVYSWCTLQERISVPIIVIEFGASYCRITKFSFYDNERISINNHKVIMNINRKKLNQLVFTVLLQQMKNKDEIIKKMETMENHQKAEIWKTIDDIRIKLSASETLSTELFEQKITIQRKDFEQTLKNEIKELKDVLNELKEKNGKQKVYVTGGLGYTPILKEVVKEIYGEYSIQIQQTQILQGMKLFGEYWTMKMNEETPMMNKEEFVKYPQIDDIIPFGLIIKSPKQQFPFLTSGYQFGTLQSIPISIDLEDNKDIAICYENKSPFDSIELDSENCFAHYEVLGNIKMSIIPLNQGLISDFSSTQSFKQLDKHTYDIKEIIKKERRQSNAYHKRVEKKTEYEILLLKYKEDEAYEKELNFKQHIDNELNQIDDEELPSMKDIEMRMEFTKKFYETLDENYFIEKEKREKEQNEMTEKFKKKFKLPASFGNGDLPGDANVKIEEYQKLVKTTKETIEKFRMEMKKRNMKNAVIESKLKHLEELIDEGTLKRSVFVDIIDEIKQEFFLSSFNKSKSYSPFGQLVMVIVILIFIFLIGYFSYQLIIFCQKKQYLRND